MENSLEQRTNFNEFRLHYFCTILYAIWKLVRWTKLFWIDVIREKKSNSWSDVLRRNSLRYFLWRFCQEITGKTYNLFAHWNRILFSETALKSLNCSCHYFGLPPVLKMAALSSCFIQATNAQDIAVLKVLSAKNLRYCYLCFYRKVSGHSWHFPESFQTSCISLYKSLK